MYVCTIVYTYMYMYICICILCEIFQILQRFCVAKILLLNKQSVVVLSIIK